MKNSSFIKENWSVGVLYSRLYASKIWSGRVKVTISKRQQAANKNAERLLKLWAKLAEAPTPRGKEAIMDEIWKSRESKPLPQDQLPTKNDILLHENYLVRQGKLRASASMVSGAKVRATDVIGVWTRCNVKTLPFRKVQDKCKYLLEARVKHKKASSWETHHTKW